MSIKRISIRNLLSYKAIDIDIGGQLNVFVGRNGSGKSNFFNSLLFVLTDKFQYHDRQMLENNILSDKAEVIQVQIVIDNRSKRLPISNDEVIFTRQFSTRDEFMINNKSTTLQQITNTLQCINLSRSNYYNIIRQGKITKIAQMRDTDLYQLLEEVSGVSLYEQKKQEALSNVELAVQEKDDIVKILGELGNQIKQLQDEKDAFNQLKEIQKQIQLHEVQLSMISAKNFKHQLVDLNSEQSKLHQMLQQLNIKEDTIRVQIYKHDKSIDTDEQMEIQIKQQIAQQQSEFDRIRNQQSEILLQSDNQQKKLQSIKSTDSTINLKNIKQKEQEIYGQLQNNQDIYARVEKDIQFLQLLQTEDPVKRIKEEVQSLQQQLDSYSKEYKTIEYKISQANKDINKLKQLSSNQIDPKLLQHEIQTMEKHSQQLNKQLEEVQLNNLNKAKTRTQLQQRLIKLQNDQDVECKQFDRQLRDIYTVSLFKIFKYAKEVGLVIYGVFAQLIEVQNERLLPIVEIAAGPRLFSLIVPDANTAKMIIDFNKEQQGCVLRIYPLDMIDDRVTTYDNPKDAIDICTTTMIGANIPKKEALKQKLIGRWLCVKDYQTALDISMKYEVNCITMDNEVVYADSFITRVGATRVQVSKSAALKKIIAVQQEIEEIEQKDAHFMKDLDSDQNQLLQLQREVQDNKNKLSTLYQQLRSQDNKQITIKEKEIESLENLSNEISSQIQHLTIRMKEMQQQLKNPKQLKKRLTDDNIDKLQQLLNQKQKIAQQISQLLNDKNDLKLTLIKKPEVDQSKIAELEFEINQLEQTSKQLNIALQQSTQTIQELKNSALEYRNNASQLKKLRDELKQQRDQIAIEIESIHNQQNELENESKRYLIKLDTLDKDKQMIDAFDEVQEELSKNQIIRKIKELKQRFNHKFTQKDQSLFEKLNDIETKFTDYQERLNQLRLIQGDFDNLCIYMDRKAQTMLQDGLFKKFSEYFRYYFLKIVPNGECQVRLIKGLKKTKQNWGIDIKISFKSKEVQNWMQFSSGEKTVVAFVIVIALQKCDPAPFYILDEFDAALDDNYRVSIANIIHELSQESQQELLNFNDDTTKYYKVVHSNQQSGIVKIESKEARKIINKNQKQQQQE